MHPYTEAALRRLGASADGFASEPLDAEHVEWADLILTMTADHRDEVLAVSPRGMRKVFTLGEAAALSGDLPATIASDDLAGLLGQARGRRRGALHADDVTDPIEGPAGLHEEVVDEIARHLSTLLDALAVRMPRESDTVQMVRLPPVPPARRA